MLQMTVFKIQPEERVLMTVRHVNQHVSHEHIWRCSVDLILFTSHFLPTSDQINFGTAHALHAPSLIFTRRRQVVHSTAVHHRYALH